MSETLNTNPCINSEAHKALQYLHRHSTEDEDYDDDGGDEVEVEVEGITGVEDDGEDEEIKRIVQTKSDSALASQHFVDQLNHPICSSKPTLPLTSRPFSTGFGRGAQCIPITPVVSPVKCDDRRVTQNTNIYVAQMYYGKHSATSTSTLSKQSAGPIQKSNVYSQPFNSNQPFDEKIDFSFKVLSTRVIFVNTHGYRRACELFRSRKIEYAPTRNYPDIWSFCLNSRTVRFSRLSNYEPIKADLPQKLQIQQTHLCPYSLLTQKEPFWFQFENRPEFEDTMFNDNIAVESVDPTPITNNTILGKILFCREVHLNLSYGALTSMNDYYYHPEYNFQKSNEWKITFRLKKLEIDRLEEKKVIDGNRYTKKYRRSVIPADLIDRTAIITVNQLGFTVYICTKGNVHEFTAVSHPNSHRVETERSSSFNEDCPIFSTVCIHALVKSNQSYANYHNEKYRALGQVKELFKYFLDFFYSNQISVCFAYIKHHLGCLTNLPHLSDQLTDPIQLYAFSMLRNVGYRTEQKLSDLRTLQTSLLNLAGNDNDKFYRLCLYLFRRATEFHFLDLKYELKQADDEYRMQLEQCQAVNETMATILSPPRPNYAYVPSIRITPTTIQIHPFKLVKLHRVIRDMNFKDPMSYALVEIRDEAKRALYARDFRSLRDKFGRILTEGIRVNKSRYQYLHHSMSQIKEKQFWFLDKRYSLTDVLAWMGNFDSENVIAKHAARIALCFTSTEPSIRIPAALVTYIPDIETPDKQYCFTDGVGTISQTLCKKVQNAMGRRLMPSVLQIRYGGCKGTLSVDPTLDDKRYHLVIRESMRKFTSEHDRLEICKVSSPRALYLNRQNILLLSSRNISDSYFLVLQNENHLWLVQALLCSSIAFELLNDRVGSLYFNFRDIANALNLVEEPFFLQLIITCGHDCVSKFQQRAKIKVARDKARNMFGIVDEYGVLEYGQVFIQYSHINDEKLESPDKPAVVPPKVLDNVQVVITKNPCHHPGDLRTFTAVDRRELRHLVDVVVFPQKGLRPHPNEISGSDLDGDEYAVIWDPDLVPKTENDAPYDYDSQEKPKKFGQHIERTDIINVVLDIAAQNLTGDMSNTHLALADKLDPRHPEVSKLAGLISQELDAPKTGKHPISSEELNTIRHELLQGLFPDFMMRERYKSYSSEKTIGQLYRSARRAIIRWYKATRTHCSLRHLHSAQLDDELYHENDSPIPNGHSYQDSSSSEVYYEPSLIPDPLIRHPLSDKENKFATTLFSQYREGLRNIISVFNYQDEVDLFCRCEALDQLTSGKQDLNISAALELQRLIDTTRRHFYRSFDQLVDDPDAEPPHSGPCTRNRSCEKCKEVKLARAAACYNVCYTAAAWQSTKARSRILSFPWLFSSFLIELRKENQKSNNSPSKHIVIGRAMRNVAKRLLEENDLKLKVYVAPYAEEGRLFLRTIKSIGRKTIKPLNVEPDIQTNTMCLIKILFIEIMNHWIQRQKIFGDPTSICRDKKPLIREICWHQLLQCFIREEDDLDLLNSFEEHKIVFQTKHHHIQMTERYTKFIQSQTSIQSTKFDTAMYEYSVALIRVCFQLARQYRSNEYAYLSDYLVLALQSIGIEKDFNDIIFDLDN
ncbi:unnamed protein product [Adineta ricciae]|uniref:RNA-directed RNA polymerase n=1 Tax=Adineta ricciae TaxID=249248 RepID=A0A814BZC3_ADIRI|nr:unnamed protein product [Adineta ricciae]